MLTLPSNAQTHSLLSQRWEHDAAIAFPTTSLHHGAAESHPGASTIDKSEWSDDDDSLEERSPRRLEVTTFPTLTAERHSSNNRSDGLLEAAEPSSAWKPTLMMFCV